MVLRLRPFQGPILQFRRRERRQAKREARNRDRKETKWEKENQVEKGKTERKEENKTSRIGQTRSRKGIDTRSTGKRNFVNKYRNNENLWLSSKTVAYNLYWLLLRFQHKFLFSTKDSLRPSQTFDTITLCFINASLKCFHSVRVSVLDLIPCLIHKLLTYDRRGETGGHSFVWWHCWLPKSSPTKVSSSTFHLPTNLNPSLLLYCRNLTTMTLHFPNFV